MSESTTASPAGIRIKLKVPQPPAPDAAAPAAKRTAGDAAASPAASAPSPLAGKRSKPSEEESLLDNNEYNGDNEEYDEQMDDGEEEYDGEAEGDDADDPAYGEDNGTAGTTPAASGTPQPASMYQQENPGRGRVSQAKKELVRKAMVECFEKLLKVMDGDRQRCEAFMTLPDKSQDPNYYNVIEKPIALRDIHERVTAGKYVGLQKLADDVKQVFLNAQTYYPANSQPFLDSQILSQVFDTAVTEAFLQVASGDKPVSLQAAAGSPAGQAPKCPYCKQIFMQRSSVARHLRRVHGISEDEINQLRMGYAPAGLEAALPAVQSAASKKAAAKLTPGKSGKLPPVGPAYAATLTVLGKRTPGHSRMDKTGRYVLQLAQLSKSDHPRAAIQILSRANRVPMFYKDIAKMAADQGLINSSSTSMMSTMNGQLNRCLDFYAAGLGFFGMTAWRDEQGIVPGPPVVPSKVLSDPRRVHGKMAVAEMLADKAYDNNSPARLAEINALCLPQLDIFVLNQLDNTPAGVEVHKLLAILEETINTEEGRAAIDEAAAQLVASDTKGAAPTTEVGGSAETETAAAAETEISATETPSVQPREPSPAVVVTDAAAMPAPPVAAGQTQKLEQPTVPPLPEQPTAEEARPMQVDEPEQPVRQEEPAQPVRQEEPEQPVRQEEPEQPVKREEPEQPPQAGQAGQDEQPVQPVQQEPEAPPPRENGTLAPASVDAGEGEAEQEEDAQAEEEEDDDYWRGKEKPSLNSLHRTFHIVGQAGFGRLRTGLPWLQRALGYNFKVVPDTHLTETKTS